MGIKGLEGGVVSSIESASFSPPSLRFLLPVLSYYPFVANMQFSIIAIFATLATVAVAAPQPVQREAQLSCPIVVSTILVHPRSPRLPSPLGMPGRACACGSHLRGRSGYAGEG